MKVGAVLYGCVKFGKAGRSWHFHQMGSGAVLKAPVLLPEQDLEMLVSAWLHVSQQFSELDVLARPVGLPFQHKERCMGLLHAMPLVHR